MHDTMRDDNKLLIVRHPYTLVDCGDVLHEVMVISVMLVWASGKLRNRMNCCGCLPLFIFCLINDLAISFFSTTED